MPAFGPASKARLAQLHPDLQRLLNKAILYVDFSITCGYRGKVEQDEACAKGLSKTPWPTSKHNSMPSRAVDVAPYPCDWNDSESFTLLAGILYGIAVTMGIRVRLGADWDGDLNTREHSFKDRPHLELLD